MQKHHYFPRKLQSSCATRTESVLIILGKAIIELLALRTTRVCLMAGVCMCVCV